MSASGWSGSYPGNRTEFAPDPRRRMAKTCPSCGYRPIGPFTDNCPMCAEPVRNVRSDRPGGFSGPGNWVKWVVAGSVAVVLAVAGCCGVGMWRMGQAMKDAQQQVQAQMQAEAQRKANPVVVSAADLIRDFQDDPAAADRKYTGKYLEVTGVVERTGHGRYDRPFALLTGGKDDKATLKVECFFDSADAADEARIKRLAPGDKVTVRGEFDGHVANVLLRDCMLVP